MLSKKRKKILVSAFENVKFPRKSQAEWDKKHMRTASCRINASALAQFRTFCEINEITMHRILRSYIAHLVLAQYGDWADESLQGADALYRFVEKNVVEKSVHKR